MITKKALREAFGSKANQLYSILVDKTLSVEEKLEDMNTLLDEHGVEALLSEYAFVSPYWRQCIALYINRGDTYDTTIVYSTETSEWFVMSWGAWYESTEHCEIQRKQDEEMYNRLHS